jgi:hypothetical protein
MLSGICCIAAWLHSGIDGRLLWKFDLPYPNELTWTRWATGPAPGETDMATQQLRVVVFQEEDAWVAHCLEYDIGAQAPDLKSLQRRFNLTLKVELEESIRRHGKPFGGIDAAPPYIQAMWDQQKPGFRLTGSAEAHGAEPTRADYEMALLAA